MFNYTTQQTIIQMFRMFFDILILWVLLYYTIKIVRNNSRTTQIFKGIILILIIRAIANFFGFKAVDWLAGVLVTYGFLAIIIIFQPEIRSLLEKLGKSSVFSRLNTLSVNERLRLVDELVNATMACSTSKVGALITLEQGHSLSDFIKTGTRMNSIVTADLLQTIFMPSTPLHDGAVIIQGDRIACASAYFPPTNLEVPSRYGARHRAAIGISEITDSVTIVVSEKTGRISIAEEGKLITMNQQSLRSYLEQVILQDEEEVYDPDPNKAVGTVQKEEVQIPKPITFKTKENMPEVKPTDRLNFNFKGLFKKKLKVKKTNQTEEPKVTKVEETLENQIEETKVVQVEEVNLDKTEAISVDQVEVQNDPKEVLEDVLNVVKEKLSTKTVNKPIKKRTSKKKAVEEKVEQAVSEEVVHEELPQEQFDQEEIVLVDPLEVKEEKEVTIKSIPHIKLEYSVSDDSLLDDEEESKGGEQ